ncbi:MAG TPA: type II toxin-antitoxin system Phd/YefM family antitoxin [Tepidiformaceae bacterium]|nr:type II toxin-antitoxin system Phd/YefM family antitoxin [Tepidiformaceae bacterium]
MSSVTIRELSRRTSRVVDAVQETGRPAFVTRNGRLVAAVIPVDEEALEDFILSTAPDFLDAMREADEDLKAGETRSLTDVLKEMGTVDVGSGS